MPFSRVRPFRRLLAVVAVSAVVLAVVPLATPAQAAAGPHDYTRVVNAASGIGPIPDATSGCESTLGYSTIDFPVTGIDPSQVTDVSLSITMSHPWVGDLDVNMDDPTRSSGITFIKRPGKTSSAASCGSDSDLNGTYVFSDDASTTIAAATGGALVRPGSYLPSSGSGLTGLFTQRNPTGTWKLYVGDRGKGSIGTVAAAKLVIRLKNPPPDTAINSGPAEGGRVTPGEESVVGFTSSATDLAGFQCSLDGAAFAPCPNPAPITLVALGIHRIQVRAIDQGGAVDESPDTRTVVVTGSARCERAAGKYVAALTRLRAAAAALAQTQATGTHKQVVRAKKAVSKAKRAFKSAKKAWKKAC